MQVLQAVDNAWRTKRDRRCSARAQALVAHLAEHGAPRPGGEPRPGRPDARRRGAAARCSIPSTAGSAARRNSPTRRSSASSGASSFAAATRACAAAVRALLDALCAGGIYDHLGGGFARYSTDAEWHVPHFEKMLYDNAQILELLALAHAETPTPLYAARARETFGWLMREMRVGDAFAASQDADQDGEEGLFYVWSAERDRRASSARTRPAFKAAYDVRRGGNWEGRNVLRRVTPPGDAAAEARLAASQRAAVRAARGAREAGARRQDPRRLERPDDRGAGARRRRLRRARVSGGRPRRLRLRRETLARRRRAASPMPGAPAASARRACSTITPRWRAPRSRCSRRPGEPDYLDAATPGPRAAQALFGAADGGLYLTARDAADAPASARASPTTARRRRGVGLMAEVFARLFHLTDEAALARGRRAPDPRLRGRARGARAEPAAARGGRSSGARRLRRRRRPARRPAGSSARRRRARRRRPGDLRAAPRPRALAVRRARRPAGAAEDAGRDVVPRPDVRAAGEDGRGAAAGLVLGFDRV